MYKGVALSVLASATFGVLYFYTQFLTPLDSEQTFAWRMLATCAVFNPVYVEVRRLKAYCGHFSGFSSDRGCYRG